MEQTTIIKCSFIGELITHNLMRYEPTDQDTGEEAHDRQQQLSCYKVEQIEQ